MNGVWDKKNQPWRLPDSPEKGDGPTRPSDPADLAAESGAPEFKLDLNFAANLPQTVVPGSVPYLHPPEDKSKAEAGALEVGAPGEFVTVAHEHGVQLSSQTNAERTGLGGGSNTNPFVMIDDPLPESLGGGSAAVQDMFVREVMQAAQVIDKQPPDVFSQEIKTSSLIEFAPVQKEFAAPSDADKTMIMPETRAGNSDLSFPNARNFSDTTGVEPTIATGVQPFALADNVLQPDSPTVVDLSSGQSFKLSQESNPNPSQSPPTGLDSPMQPAKAAPVNQAPVQGTTSVAKPAPESAAAKPAEKAKPAAKSGASGGKGKAAGGDKKGANSQKAGAAGATGDKAAGGNKKGDALPPQTQMQSSAAAAAANVRALPRDARIVLGVLLSSIVLAISLFAIKQFNGAPETPPTAAQPSAQQTAGAVANPSAGAASPTATTAAGPESQASPADAQQPGESVGVAAKTIKKDAPVEVKTPGDAEDEIDESDEADLETTSEALLTRPVSRYSQGNRILLPLSEASVALDRVQPRKVLNVLKNLPPGFAQTDSVERTAMREVTARFYLQVGAYSKAGIFFRQACTDPAKSSDFEVCLHAARAMLILGSQEEFEAIMEGLSVRMIGQANQWREWLKILRVSSELSKKNLESLLKFTDEMIDKGPFLTSEWNLQLSAYFARVLLSVPAETQVEYLKAISSDRRKMFEVRLSPDAYGPDIGSYMMPAVLNILLRHYEMNPLNFLGEEPETDSEFSLTAWLFHVIAQAKMNEPRQTRARLAPLFAEKTFAPLARIIEGQLAALAGDFLGANSMISEQIGIAVENLDMRDEENLKRGQAKQFLLATQRLKDLPFLYVEWLFLGVKVSYGLSDREAMKVMLVALEDARKRFPELSQEFQYWLMLGRAHRLLGNVSGVDMAAREASRLAFTIHDKGFIAADRVWILMKSNQQKEARVLMRQSLREFPHHARLLETGAQFAAQWAEDPSSYLKLESEIPKKFENRGRDRALVSFFTIRKLLSNF